MDQSGIYRSSKGHGPRTAGNKSLVSFRAGYGITGYEGYIPSSEAIPIPVKGGPSTRAGPEDNRDRGQANSWITETAGEVGRAATVYQATIGRWNSFGGPTRRAATVSSSLPSGLTGLTGGGATAGSPSLATTAFGRNDVRMSDDKPPNPAFTATTMYSHSYGPKAFTKKALSDGASIRAKKAAYLQGTTYAYTYDNSTEIVYGIGWLDAKMANPPEQQTYGTKWKEVVVQRMPEDTVYHSDFGPYGEGVQGMLPTQKNMISTNGTTRALFHGTSKAYLRIPGYQGFLPSSAKNPVCVAQSLNDHDRPDPKNIRLFYLGQYKTDIPGTSSYHPRDAANLIKGSSGREGTATYYANAYMNNPENLEAIAKKRGASVKHGCVQATKKFFQGGEMSVSENGMKNAEAFYKLVRPYEGLPRISLPSATTESGYGFKCYGETA